MSRPRLTIGTFGEITTRKAASGRFESRTRYRDWDGRARQVAASVATARAAEHALKAKLAERSLFQPGPGTLSPDSPFPDLVAYWLEDIDLEGRISMTTRNLYERNMRTLVLPAFGALTLREIGVARCDQFIMMLGKQSYNRAKQARVVLRLALQLGVRHEVLARNPMEHISRLHREARMPDALTSLEVNAIPPSSPTGSPASTMFPARGPTASLAPSWRSCSAPPPASGRCWRSAAATWTSPAARRRSGSPAPSSAGTARPPYGRTTPRRPSPAASSPCRGSPPRQSGAGWP